LLNRGTREFPWPEANIQQILCDRNDTPGLKEKLTGLTYDAVIDMVLSDGTQAKDIIELLQEKCSQYVMISTLSAYAPPYQCPVREEDPLETNTANAYGYHKAQAEEALMAAYRDHGFPATILRLPAVYGEYDVQIREKYYIKRIIDQRTQILLPEGGVGAVHREYAGNIAAQLAFLLTKPETIGEVYNSGHHRVQTYRALVEDALAVMDHKMALYSVPAPLHPAVPDLAWPMLMFQSTAKLEALGWQEPFTPLKALERTIAWLRQEPDEIIATHRNKERHFDYAKEDEVIAAHGVLLR